MNRSVNRTNNQPVNQPVTQYVNRSRPRKPKPAFNPAGHMTAKARPQETSYSRFVRGGYVTLAFLVLGLGGWATFSKIEGAVIAPGTVIVEGDAKTVQHLNGGVIKDIYVKDSDFVQKGDVIMSLDPTVADATTALANSGYFETLAQIARLEAERDDRPDITWPSALRRTQSSRLDVRSAMQGQTELFRSRSLSFQGRVQQYEQKIAQSWDQIRGLQAQLNAAQSQSISISQELDSLRDLLRQNIIPKSRVVALEREKVSLEGRSADFAASMSRLNNVIAETQTAIAQSERERLEDILTDLRAAQIQLNTYAQQRASAGDISKRIEIKAPSSGLIHNMEKTTLGGVIRPGEEILQIIPKDQRLIVEARVSPQDIDKVIVGQFSNVRFSAFNQRKTPEVTGRIDRVSAEHLTDKYTGMTFFKVDISFEPSELERLSGQALLPGMPADVFIKTGSHSVMRYLLKPAQDSMSFAMREE